MESTMVLVLVSFCLLVGPVLAWNIPCFGHICQNHNYCKITKEHGRFNAHCAQHHGDLCEHHNYMHDTSTHTCSCSSQDCIGKVLGHDHVCLDSSCPSNEYCHIFVTHGHKRASTETVKSNCVSDKSTITNCVNHDSIYQPNGCYCNNSTCVKNVGLQYEDSICPSNKTMKVYVDHGKTKVECHDSIHGLQPCEEPFIPGTRHQPCFCSTQHCLDNIQRQATSIQSATTTTTQTPTTSTPTTMRPTTSTPTTTRPTTSTATTTRPTTSTPTTTRPTTSTPTTTRPTTSTPTTTRPTTSTPTTTRPTTRSTLTTTRLTTSAPTLATHRVCQVCGDPNIGIPCRADQIQSHNTLTPCTGVNIYCMTDVIQDDRGNVDIFKRCVDRTVCEQKWVNESANRDYCRNYGLGAQSLPFACHFCCIGDGCNTHIIPNEKSWFV